MTDLPDSVFNVPAEVRAFFSEAAALRNPELRFHPLTEEESGKYSEALRGIAVADALGLIVLDDANDSNPYCYIGKGLARGMIIHFSHDPEPRLAFRSIGSFRAALLAAIAEGRDIDELQPEPIIPAERQEELISLLLESAAREDEVSQFLVCTLLPLLDPVELAVLERLAANDNFLFREAVAVFIRNHPLPVHRGLAEVLARDNYGQVARPAAEALRRLRR